MIRRNELFPSENSLVSLFCSLLETTSHPWGSLSYIREFNYIRGRTDVVALKDNGELIAFEMKLVKWRDAVQQAYKNTCFAHNSYIVLPLKTARLASANQKELAIRSVGLCTIENGEISILSPAKRLAPIQPWLSNIAINKTNKEKWDARSSSSPRKIGEGDMLSNRPSL